MIELFEFESLSHWLKLFEWLENHVTNGEGRMYCKICRKYESIGTFVTGCRTFKIEGIRAHNTSNSHTKNNLRFQAKHLKPGTSEAERALLSMNKSVVPQLFTDFTWLRDLDEAKGLNIGYTYRNDQRAREFVAAIATDVLIKVSNVSTTSM